jgi:hypothetical protein
VAPAPQSPPKARPRLRCLRLVDGEPDGLANQARARTCFPRFGLVADVEQSPSEARDRCDPGCRRISQPGALRKERCLDRAADGTRRSPQLILFRISRLGGCIMSISLLADLASCWTVDPDRVSSGGRRCGSTTCGTNVFCSPGGWERLGQMIAGMSASVFSRWRGPT